MCRVPTGVHSLHCPALAAKRMQEGQKVPSRPELDNTDANVWLAYLAEKWDGMTLQQKLWTGAAGLALLAVVPRALLVIFVGAERVVVGGLMLLEEVLVEGLFRATALVRRTLWCSVPVPGAELVQAGYIS